MNNIYDDDMIYQMILKNDTYFFDENRIPVDYTLKKYDQDTLLLMSISIKDNIIFKYFISNNANLFAVNSLKENIIHSIVYSKDVSRIDYVMNINNTLKGLLNEQDKDGITPLLWSVLLKDYKMFRKLIEYGADITIPDNDINFPIHMACHVGSFNMVKYLIKLGAQIHIKNKKENYPIALAINGDHTRIVDYIYNYFYKKILNHSF